MGIVNALKVLSSRLRDQVRIMKQAQVRYTQISQEMEIVAEAQQASLRDVEALHRENHKIMEEIAALDGSVTNARLGSLLERILENSQSIEDEMAVLRSRDRDMSRLVEQFDEVSARAKKPIWRVVLDM